MKKIIMITMMVILAFTANSIIAQDSSYVNLWYGKSDLAPIIANICHRIYLDVYAQAMNATVGDIMFSLAVSDEYFDCYTDTPDISLFFPLS